MHKSVGFTLLLAIFAVSSFFLVRAVEPRSSEKTHQRIFTFSNIDYSQPLVLNFTPYRVRVDGWDHDYVQVQVDGVIIQPVTVTSIGNTYSLQASQFQPPLWEPAVRVKAPRGTSVYVKAREVWAKDCLISDLDVRRAYLRNTGLPEKLQSQLSQQPGTGWQTLAF